MSIQPLEIIADHYGKDHQLLKTAEECGELQRAIVRYILNPTEENYRNLIEEMADVKVMLLQDEYLLDAEEEVLDVATDKVIRQMKRMENEK